MVLDEMVLESAEYSRDLIRSEKFRGLYPELDLKEDKDNKSNFKVVKKVALYPGHAPRVYYGGNRFSTSVGGTVTGFHGHINIIDDPLNPKQAASEKELKTANHWVDQTISSRKTNKKVSVLVLIMQRLHQDDPTGHILAKKKKKIRHICLPGEIKNYRKFVNPPELAEYYVDDLLDPRRLDWEDLEEMEADLGQYGYAGQVGQNPVPPGGGMFQVDQFHVIDNVPSEVNFLETVRYWDKAGSEGKGCFTVGVKMSHLTNNRFIIHDVRRGQWGTNAREKVIRDTAEADGHNVTVYIEQEPGSGGKESAEATISNLAGYSCYADRPTGDKAFRADPFSVQVNNGRVQLLRGDWNKVFTDECEYFPFGTYKDQIDAAAGAFNHLVGTRDAQVLGRNRR
jgi:predicted phage terminase large subunit-like protein